MGLELKVQGARMRIMICFSNFLFAEGLRNILRDEDQFDVQSCKNISPDPQIIKSFCPDVIISDVEAIQENTQLFSKGLRVKCLILSSSPEIFTAFRAAKRCLGKNLWGIMPPDTTLEMLKKAIRAVYAGELWLPRTAAREILFDSTADYGALTKQEHLIVDLICTGLRNKEIARKLNVTEQTVKSHCNRIYKKIGVTDRLQLALHFRGNPPREG
jgi:DNA-binding NarL/FixJ family response regulator